MFGHSVHFHKSLKLNDRGIDWLELHNRTAQHRCGIKTGPKQVRNGPNQSCFAFSHSKQTVRSAAKVPK